MAVMPSKVQLEQALAGKKAADITRDAARELIEEERRGRLIRDSQVQTNCRHDTWVTATFSAENNGVKVSDWITFGNLHFTQKPAFVTGSQRLSQEDEAPLSADASNFDPGQHLIAPGLAMVAAWKQDDLGYYVGAKLYLLAIGAVPEGYRVNISAVFLGPAIRAGD